MTLLNFILSLFGIIHIPKPKPRYWGKVSPLQASQDAKRVKFDTALKTKPYWAS